MKSITLLIGSWALPVLVGAVLIWPRISSRNAEEAATREKEMEALRSEVKRTKAQAAALELDSIRSRQETQELLRLRDEVRQLREDREQLAKQVERTQAEVERVEAQAQTAQDAAQEAQTLAADLEESQTEQLANAARLAEYEARINAIVDMNGGLATPEGQAAAACINNLRRIDAAKQLWALEKGQSDSAVPTSQDLAAYISRGLPLECPAGGVYTLNTVSTDPTCSIPGHTLPSPAISLAGQ